MIKIVSAAQMKEIDRSAIEQYGVPELALMENAGIQAMLRIEQLPGAPERPRIGIFCGKGNNGGDGFVLARHLHLRGYDPAVYLLAPRANLAGSAKINMEAYAAVGGRILECADESDLLRHETAIRHADVLVDAILGTGFGGELKGPYKMAVEKINGWKRCCLALDIPSGLDADKGIVHPLYVHADATITFGLPKVGMMSGTAATAVGTLHVANINFPEKLLADTPFEAWLPDDAWARATLPPRPAHAHKGTYGHAVIAGGNEGMEGAAALAALAALKVGAGLSTAAARLPLSRQFELGTLEVMGLPLAERLDDPANADTILAFIKDKSVLLLGPGMGRGPGLETLAAKITIGCNIPLIIDADGLNDIAPNKELLAKRNAPTIITPHPGEMARLIGITAGAVNADRLNCAKSFAKKYSCITVLKGARTVIAAPDGTAFINPTGNQNLASGGTGYVLGGMIAGFIAQGLTPLNAAALAVYLHGLAADNYTAEHDPYSLTASSLLAALPAAIRNIVHLPLPGNVDSGSRQEVVSADAHKPRGK